MTDRFSVTVHIGCLLRVSLFNFVLVEFAHYLISLDQTKLAYTSILCCSSQLALLTNFLWLCSVILSNLPYSICSGFLFSSAFRCLSKNSLIYEGKSISGSKIRECFRFIQQWLICQGSNFSLFFSPLSNNFLSIFLFH